MFKKDNIYFLVFAFGLFASILFISHSKDHLNLDEEMIKMNDKMIWYAIFFDEILKKGELKDTDIKQAKKIIIEEYKILKEMDILLSNRKINLSKKFLDLNKKNELKEMFLDLNKLYYFFTNIQIDLLEESIREKYAGDDEVLNKKMKEKTNLKKNISKEKMTKFTYNEMVLTFAKLSDNIERVTGLKLESDFRIKGE